MCMAQDAKAMLLRPSLARADHVAWTSIASGASGTPGAHALPNVAAARGTVPELSRIHLRMAARIAKQRMRRRLALAPPPPPTTIDKYNKKVDR